MSCSISPKHGAFICLAVRSWFGCSRAARIRRTIGTSGVVSPGNRIGLPGEVLATGGSPVEFQGLRDPLMDRWLSLGVQATVEADAAAIGK